MLRVKEKYFRQISVRCSANPAACRVPNNSRHALGEVFRVGLVEGGNCSKLSVRPVTEKMPQDCFLDPFILAQMDLRRCRMLTIAALSYALKGS